MLGLKNIATIVFGAALLMIAGIANANFFAGYGNSDFYFQVYSGGTYTTVATPYTYSYANQYYFDYPFRAHYANQYYYYNSGWYDFTDGYWNFTTTGNFCSSCYSYYSPNYYYYDGYWTYAPNNWVGTYGAQYYGSYYYAPRQATLVGQQFQPKQEATCSELELSASSYTLGAGDTKKAVFYIINSSKMDIDIADAQIFIDGFGANAQNIKFDKAIAHNKIGKIEFDLKSDSDAQNKMLNAKVKVSGTFRDGTYCAPSETEKDFTVSVYSTRPTGHSEINAQQFRSQVQGSTAYLQAKEAQQGWTQVNLGNYNSGNYNAYNNPANYGSQGYYGNSNSNTGNYSGNNSNLDGRQAIVTDYGVTQFTAQNCSGLSISAQNISVDAQESKTGYFTIKNFAPEDFSIDSMETIEYSPDFEASVSRDSARIYAGGTGVLKIKVYASQTEQDSTGSAHVKVLGHFNSGLSCEFLSENFYVRVNGADRATAADISLDFVPKL